MEENRRAFPTQDYASDNCGHLKIFLGYASGVGKTMRMLQEAKRRRERGQDIVVIAVQPNLSPEAQEILKQLEVIPLKVTHGKPAIDTEAVLKRSPEICIVDGLAYDNPQGSRNPSRWQDVQDLVDAGLKIVATINIQYITELQGQAEAITNKHVVETVPISFISSADEIELVDASTENPTEELVPGGPAFERKQQLSKLRELALLLAADVVEHQLTRYLERQGICQQFGANERVLVCITPRANISEMLETGQVIAERFHGELIVAYVSQPEISAADQAALDEKLNRARLAGARIEILEGEDPVQVLLDFAKSRGVTQLFIGHSQRRGLWSNLWRSPAAKLIRLSRGMDVRVFPQ